MATRAAGGTLPTVLRLSLSKISGAAALLTFLFSATLSASTSTPFPACDHQTTYTTTTSSGGCGLLRRWHVWTEKTEGGCAQPSPDGWRFHSVSTKTLATTCYCPP